MFQNNSRYQLALIFAVIFHVILLFFILFKMNFSGQLPTTSQNNVHIVQAVAISASQVQQQVKELKQQQDTKQQAEKEKLAKIKQAAQKAKEQVQQEQQKIAKLKAQQQAIQQQKVAAQKLQQQKAADTKAATDAQAKKIAEQKAAADAQAKKVAQQKALQQQQQKDADDLMQQQLAQEQAQLNANKTQAIDSALNKYAALITSAISQHWNIPDGVDKNSSCTLVIRLAPNGTVLDVQLSQSSGNASLDQSAIKAVYKASPLPVPTDPSVFSQMRVLNLTVRPEDILNS